MENGFRRTIWLAVGFAALALGALGAVLPVLPTTPFVILAAFAFSRCSPRLELWLLNNPTFGPMIDQWRKNGAIAPRAKLLAVLSMAMVFGISWAVGLSATILAIQGICLLAVAAFVLSRPNGSV